MLQIKKTRFEKYLVLQMKYFLYLFDSIYEHDEIKQGISFDRNEVSLDEKKVHPPRKVKLFTNCTENEIVSSFSSTLLSSETTKNCSNF